MDRSPHKTITRYEFSGIAKYGSLETPQPVVSMIMNDTHTFGFALDPSDAWHRVPSHVRDTLACIQIYCYRLKHLPPRMQPLNRTMIHASAIGIFMAIQRHAIADIEGSECDVS